MKIPLEQIEEAIHEGGIGFCINCGESCEGVEPDAWEYWCEACETYKVYGAEEILIRGWVS